MKFNITLSATLLFIFALIWSGCGQKANTPEKVTEEFMTHLQKQEFDEAKKYCTEKTQKMLDMISGMAAMSDDKWEDKQGEFKEVVETEIDGDEAKVTYCCNSEGNNETADLKKVDGEWKVHMKKESGGEESKGDMKMEMDKNKNKKSKSSEKAADTTTTDH